MDTYIFPILIHILDPFTLCVSSIFLIILFVNGSCVFQDDTTFEKQSALFAIAVADIVLINM